MNEEKHEYVDLGLPSGLKWATCNVGASSPSDYGNYYAWGETMTKSEYMESGNPQYDASRANWGGSWRLPTKEEFEELIDKCTWTWTRQGGHNGYKVTGPNGNSIFVPAAGWRKWSSLNSVEGSGLYWSSTPHNSDISAYSLYFRIEKHCVDWVVQDLRNSVRLVANADNKLNKEKKTEKKNG